MILSQIKSLLTLLTVALLCYCQVSLADIHRIDISKGKGEQCVEPTDDMRRNHMEYLLHKRDRTVHEGVRTKTHSMKECINCHAVKGDDGEFLHVTDNRHFCATCHNYASVQIDCFQCHADRPEKNSENTAKFKHRLQPNVAVHHKKTTFNPNAASEIETGAALLLNQSILDVVAAEGVKND